MVEHLPSARERKGPRLLPPPFPFQLPDRVELLKLLLRHQPRAQVLRRLLLLKVVPKVPPQPLFPRHRHGLELLQVAALQPLAERVRARPMGVQECLPPEPPLA